MIAEGGFGEATKMNASYTDVCMVPIINTSKFTSSQVHIEGCRRGIFAFNKSEIHTWVLK